jgi:N-acetylmuramoyl-L-alanine amidase
MSNYRWLLDAGHGGMKDGKYTTAPAKMHVFDDGLTFYEGVNNRAIVHKLKLILLLNGIEHELVHEHDRDTPLKERVAFANSLYVKDKRCIYLSVHSDAMPDGAHGKGSGFSVFTSKGQTRSDLIAEIFCTIYQDELRQFKFRKDLSDGDADKEEDFYVLQKTNCPALLVENLFFDNRKEAEFLLSEAGQSKIALTLFKSIQATENKRPI